MLYVQWQHWRNCVIFLKNKIISKGMWPPRSPDLTPPDFLLWDILKGRVYRNRPRTQQELRNNIESEIQATTPDTLHRVQACLEAQGGHLQHLLWRSCVQHETRYVRF
jgi:hypothetical protein